MRTLVVAPGDLNEAKRLDALACAARELDDVVHVALVGRRSRATTSSRLVDAARLGDRVTLAPDVTDDDFLGWLAAADVVVDLRFPHRGEVSGSLARAMQAGRPAIVSATGTYLDAPGDAVFRVAAGPTNPSELAAGSARSLEDPTCGRGWAGPRAAISTAARTTEATARGYEAAIEDTLGLLGDPAHEAHGDLGQGARRHGRGRARSRPRDSGSRTRGRPPRFRRIAIASDRARGPARC